MENVFNLQTVALISLEDQDLGFARRNPCIVNSKSGSSISIKVIFVDFSNTKAIRDWVKIYAILLAIFGIGINMSWL